MTEVPESVWDEVVQQLVENSGVALLELDMNAHNIAREAFVVAQTVLEDRQALLQQIPDDADSAHVTGYHPAGGLSRYNEFRQGFVWSDGQKIRFCDGDESNGNEESPLIQSFETATQQLEDLLHDIAQAILNALERYFQLPVGWFQHSLGDTRKHSQWHLKRFLLPDQQNQKQDKCPVLLPTHTDPSLVSVVIHDATDQGGQGLEYSHKLCDGSREWSPLDVPKGHAVIFVGSVLGYMTGIEACKHRVVYNASNNDTYHRMAATVFARPSGQALLQVPPSPMLNDKTVKVMSFQAWNAKVARNYQKSRKQQQTQGKNSD